MTVKKPNVYEAVADELVKAQSTILGLAMQNPDQPDEDIVAAWDEIRKITRRFQRKARTD